MQINIFTTVQEVLMAVAEYFLSAARSSISAHGECNVVLSGGHSPKLLYEMLSSPQFNRQVEWDHVNFFFGDERYVPADDPQNNALMVKNALFDPLNIAASRIFTINTSHSPEESAKRYTSVISDHFKGEKARFDLILLGLGDNAHTASLFPYTSVLADQTASIKAVYLEQQNIYRITMTAPLINQAHRIAFLVYGEGKAEAVHHVLENERNEKKYPAQLIHPEKGDLQWYVDESAASRLNKLSNVR